MKVSCVALLLCLLPAVQGSVTDDEKNRPVSKVITVLKDMIGQLEKEAEEDQDIYDQMGCWCETGLKDKTKSIADAESTISSLTASIEEMTAKSATLTAEIGNLEKEVAENTEALDKATAMREKELAAFNAEEKESTVTITNLKNAVVVLSKHHASMLQSGTGSSTAAELDFLKFINLLHNLIGSKNVDMKKIMTAQQHKTLTDFVQSQEEYGSEDQYNLQPYPEQATYSLTQNKAPASGEIFGILKAMKESFETNLANSQKEEMQAQKDYEALKSAKESEVKEGQNQIDTKTQTLAETDEKNAAAKEDLEDTRASLAADNEFLSTLKLSCQTVDQEFEERTKTRELEMAAVSKALAFLSSDEAHDLFTRTFNPALIQTRTSMKSHRRAQLSQALTAAAKKFEDPRVSALAVQARLDAFTKVKKAIQDMIDKLVQEKKDEIKHKDFCIEELNNNERDTEMKERDRDDLIAKIDDLASTIDTLAKEIEVLKADVAELQVQMKRAGEDREKANKEFQTTVADQRATQKLLAAALNILKGFYEKAALVQKQAIVKQVSGQAPPPGFKSYEKNAASGGVMGMMAGIINDAKAMEAEAIRGEEDAQKTYEDFVKDSNMSIEMKVKDITSKTEMKAKAEGEKVEAETERDSVMGELEQLANENADLHKSCDFTLKNFELRQTARDDEIEALKQAIAMFSGASFSAFLSQ